MRQFLAQFRFTARQWIAFACVSGMAGIIVVFGMWLQRRDYERTLDESQVRSLEQIKATVRAAARERFTLDREVDALRADREQDRRDHERLREIAEPLQGLSRVIRALKKAARPRAVAP